MRKPRLCWSSAVALVFLATNLLAGISNFAFSQTEYVDAECVGTKCNVCVAVRKSDPECLENGGSGYACWVAKGTSTTSIQACVQSSGGNNCYKQHGGGSVSCGSVAGYKCPAFGPHGTPEFLQCTPYCDMGTGAPCVCSGPPDASAPLDHHPCTSTP